MKKPMDANMTTTGIGAIDSLVILVQNVLGFVSLAIGGIFGLYVILIYLRWKEARALRKGMDDIRNEIRSIRKDVNVLETVSLKDVFEKNGIAQDHVVVVKKPAGFKRRQNKPASAKSGKKKKATMKKRG